MTEDPAPRKTTERPPLAGYRFVVASLGLCVIASAFFAVVALPDNPRSWPLLLYPVAVALVPALLRSRRWPRIVATVLLAPISTLIFSIGLFYVPAILLMLIAACTVPTIDWQAKHDEALSENG